jgi:hypothetical protein
MAKEISFSLELLKRLGSNPATKEMPCRKKRHLALGNLVGMAEAALGRNFKASHAYPSSWKITMGKEKKAIESELRKKCLQSGACLQLDRGKEDHSYLWQKQTY